MDVKQLKVIDLFAGAGGFGLGFKLAGYDLLCSLEFDQWACDTLRENDKQHVVVEKDIRDFQAPDEIKSVCSITPDLIIGGPPCQGFSIAGPAQKDPKDPRNSLFVDFARWVEYLQPTAFVMENVKGLLSRNNAAHERVIDIIQNTFENIGYSVELWVLNAANFGVPQTRERIFIVGNNLGIDKIGEPQINHNLDITGYPEQNEQLSSFPKGEFSLVPAITLWDAISDLPNLQASEGCEVQAYLHRPTNSYQEWARENSNALFNHVAMNHSPRLVERFKHIGWGESSADVPPEHMPRTRNGNGNLSHQAYDQNNRRLHPYKPSHTIAASFYANFIHPFQHRNITAREGARLQSFPDWYRFMGKKTTPSHKLLKREGRLEDAHLCQYNQIGNAVPPLLARAIAIHLRKELFDVSTRFQSASKRSTSDEILGRREPSIPR